MSIDFPASPTENQMFQAPGGPRYVYSNGGWRMSDPGPPGTAQTRNRIVNGAMQISQEFGNTLSAAQSVVAWYPVDQWQLTWSLSPGQLTSQRVQVVTPNGSKDRVRMTVTTAKAALAAGDYMIFQQPIEGIRIADFRWGSASAKQVALRFGFKGPAGTYTASIQNGAGNRNYAANFTIAAGSANVDTEQVLVIPGDTTGTWATDTAVGLIVSITVAAGSTWVGSTGWQSGKFYVTSATTNGAATVGSVFELFDVGLYLDPLATGVAPRWEMPDEAQELLACQRYWQSLSDWRMYIAYGAAGGTFGQSSSMMPMRVAPTGAITGATYANASGLSFIGTAPNKFSVYATVGGASAQASVTTANLSFNARM